MLDPSNAYVWTNLGAAAALLNRPGEARRAYERALEIDPNNWLAHYNLGCQLARAGDTESALEELRTAIAQMKQQAGSNAEVQGNLKTMRSDKALGELRNDVRFQQILAAQ